MTNVRAEYWGKVPSISCLRRFLGTALFPHATAEGDPVLEPVVEGNGAISVDRRDDRQYDKKDRHIPPLWSTVIGSAAP